jgi:hypothetical protein
LPRYLARAIAPTNIGIAGLDTHCLGNELNPIPDPDIVATVEPCDFAMAWMKNRANGVGTSNWKIARKATPTLRDTGS